MVRLLAAFSNLLLLLAARPWVIDAVALPEGFTAGLGPSGVELAWTPTGDQPVRMGGSRPEFRLADGVLLGYPREKQGKLVLTISSKEQELLATDGQDLEVWVSGRRYEKKAGNATVPAGSGSAQLPAVVSVAAPTVPVDPAARGSSAIQRLSYTLPNLQVGDPVAFPTPIEVVGEITQPRTLAAGVKYPVVLFLHGRHATCYEGGSGGFDSSDWPCFAGTRPIPSHQGYRYVADILASQGYVTVSISANGINGQDFAAQDSGTAARSILIRHHLTLLAKWNTSGGDPWSGSRYKGKLDMDQVVLVGHSRGGEGVNRAAIDASSADPYKIVGLVSYGPTAFGRQVTPDVHSVTILPTCDGDVSDLQGQAYVDSSRDIAYSEALRSAVIALGCNHNFFNTEWTPGLAKAPSVDDWFDNADPVCGSDGGGLRLTPQEQQAVGAAYTLALVRLAVKQDAAMLQLLDGSFVRPAAIGRAEVSTHAVGGAGYRLLYRPEDDGAVVLGGGMTGGECAGYTDGNTDLPVCDTSSDAQGTDDFTDDFFSFFGSSSPHWVQRGYDSTHPAPQAAELIWTKAGATARFDLPSGQRNLTSLDWVDVRVANDPSGTGVRLELFVIDNKGRNATLPTNLTTIDGWPGENNLDRVHARALRGSLAMVRSSKKVTLSNIVAVLLVARSKSGKVWVIDIAASQSRIQKPVALNLPVLSVESLTTNEGNGAKAINIKITADQALKTSGSIWVTKGSGSESYQIDIPAGSSTSVAQIPYSFIGDRLYSGSDFVFTDTLSIGALKGVVTGNYIGGLTVVEDDPAPTLSVAASEVTAKEGQSLRWQLRLSAPTAGYTVSFFITPPVDGTELSSNDVPTSWLQSLFVTPPQTPAPLSSLAIFLSVTFPYGATTASLAVPIANDRVAEGDESVVFEGFGPDFKTFTLVGKVLKH